MYTHTRFSDMQVALSQRLDDPGNIFWTETENYRYLREALRAWNAYAQYYRARAAFSVTTPVSGNFFFDVLSVVPNLVPTITDQDLIVEIQNALIEPESATVWTGTDQFTYENIVACILRRRNEFLLQTGMVITQSGDISSVSPPDGRYELADTVIDVRRAAWRALDASNNPSDYSTLWRTDEGDLGDWRRTWSNPATTPNSYSLAVSPPLSLQLAPPPQDSGFLNLLTVSTGPALDPSDHATVLGIPDDFCWIIKYGVLQDLLSGTSPSVDLTRAEYCQARWDEGIALARISASVLNANVNGNPVEIGPLQSLDAYKAGWQNATPGTPFSLISAGWNLYTPYPTPDTIYGITLDCIQNMPIPAGAADYVQIGREFVDMILDYAFHLASFKMGGAEFLMSRANYDSLVQLASRQNEKLRANAHSFQMLQTRQMAEGKLRPRQASDINLQAINYAK